MKGNEVGEAQSDQGGGIAAGQAAHRAIDVGDTSAPFEDDALGGGIGKGAEAAHFLGEAFAMEVVENRGDHRQHQDQQAGHRGGNRQRRLGNSRRGQVRPGERVQG